MYCIFQVFLQSKRFKLNVFFGNIYIDFLIFWFYLLSFVKYTGVHFYRNTICNKHIHILKVLEFRRYCTSGMNYMQIWGKLCKCEGKLNAFAHIILFTTFLCVFLKISSAVWQKRILFAPNCTDSLLASTSPIPICLANSFCARR